MTEYLGPIKITKAYKQVSRHGKNQISVSCEIHGIFPRGRRPHLLSFSKEPSRGTYWITPLYTHLAGYVHVPIPEVENFVKSLPIVNYKPTPVAPSDWPEAEELAKGVTNPTIAILDLKGISPQQDLRRDYDEKAEVEGGILYRKANVIQVWWEKDHGKETWTNPSVSQAEENFNRMREMWEPRPPYSKEPEPHYELIPEREPRENLYWLTISELKQKCRERDLPDSGSKEDLVRRLKK